MRHHLRRRPGERRDPYAEAACCGTMVGGLRITNARQALWVPAFAGTTR